MKDMVVAPVDQRDLDIGSLERACGRDAGETAADDQHALLAGKRLRYGWLFLRERFGENCSHESTDGFEGQPPDQHRIARRVGSVLNGVAAHRTSVSLFIPARQRALVAHARRFPKSLADGLSRIVLIEASGSIEAGAEAAYWIEHRQAAERSAKLRCRY